MLTLLLGCGTLCCTPLGRHQFLGNAWRLISPPHLICITCQWWAQHRSFYLLTYMLQTHEIWRLVGSVAQWLGRRSLAGGLSQPCNQSMDLWMTGDHCAGKLSTMGQSTSQLGFPSLQRRKISSDVIHVKTWITKVETKKTAVLCYVQLYGYRPKSVTASLGCSQGRTLRRWRGICSTV